MSEEIDLTQIQRKCFTCDTFLRLGSSLSMKFCGECSRDRRLISTNSANRTRSLKRTYSRMLASYKTSINIFIKRSRI